MNFLGNSFYHDQYYERAILTYPFAFLQPIPVYDNWSCFGCNVSSNQLEIQLIWTARKVQEWKCIAEFYGLLTDKLKHVNFTLSSTEGQRQRNVETVKPTSGAYRIFVCAQNTCYSLPGVLVDVNSELHKFNQEPIVEEKGQYLQSFPKTFSEINSTHRLNACKTSLTKLKL